MTNMFIAERNLLCQNYVDKARSVWICSTVDQSFSTLLKTNCPRGCLLEGIMALSVVPQTVAVIDDIHLLDFLCIPGDHTLDSSNMKVKGMLWGGKIE